MARNRQLGRIDVGEYNATVFWQEGKGVEERPRYAESTGVGVTETWVFIYLRDGAEIVKLSRKRNTSALLYIDMTLRDVMRERVRNHIRNSTSCCYAGERKYEFSAPGKQCTVHTPEWIEQEIDRRIDELISDEAWPAVLERRKIEAA